MRQLDSLRLMDGIAGIYLPDLKVWTSGHGRRVKQEPPIWTAFEFSILRVVTMHNGLIWMAGYLRICARSRCLASDL